MTLKMVWVKVLHAKHHDISEAATKKKYYQGKKRAE